MKKIICIIICIVILVLIIAIGKNYLKNKNNSNNLEETNSNSIINIETEKISKLSNILEKGEMNTRGLFDLGNGTNYSIDLMANDMTWNPENSLYHKVITNMEDYNKYKDRINIPTLTEKDFETKFLVVVSNENIRDDDEKDLFIYDVYSDNNITNIVMKQKENPNLSLGNEEQNNVFYAVVDKKQLKEMAKVIIDK